MPIEPFLHVFSIDTERESKVLHVIDVNGAVWRFLHGIWQLRGQINLMQW